MEVVLTVVGLVLVVGYVVFTRSKTPKKIESMPSEWKAILFKEVDFYKRLSPEEKILFEADIMTFLSRVNIVGVETEVEDLDRILVASGAVIPIFRFKAWMYPSLTEVILYPNSFNHNFETSGEGRSVLGMVGSGVLNGKVLLSKKSLRTGFSNITDKKNVAVHEFVHLIDGLDGAIDGVPKLLLENQHAIPWMELMRQKMKEVNSGKTNINTYGGVAPEEFFAVTSEYFFERPKLLKKKHPKLYEQLNEMFGS